MNESQTHHSDAVAPIAAAWPAIDQREPASAGGAPTRPASAIAEVLLCHLDDRRDAIAVRAANETRTAHELKEAALAIAGDMAQAGLAPGSRVALDLPRSVALLELVLGACLAGVSYVPVPRGLPWQGRRDLATKARCRAIVSNDPGEAPEPGAHAPGSPLGMRGTLHRLEPDADPEPGHPSSGPEIYCIRTSGSTGEPKRVPIRERQLAAFLRASRAPIGAEAGASWLWMHDLSFDLSVWEIFGCLFNDGCVVVLDEATKHDPARTRRFIGETTIAFLTATPSEFRFLYPADTDPLASLSSLKTLLFCGEKLTGATIASVFEPLVSNGCRIINTYGPSEATVFCTAHHVRPSDLGRASVPFGAMLEGMDFELAASDMPQAGELVLFGDQVFDGYEDRPPLAGGYPTGDICQPSEDAGLVFLNRSGGFAKVNGHRVDTREIEEHLLLNNTIDEAVVLVEEEDDGEFLLACVMAREGGGLTTRDIRKFCGELRPYLRPARYLVVQPGDWPLSAHGKTNLNALRSMAHDRL